MRRQKEDFRRPENRIISSRSRIIITSRRQNQDATIVARLVTLPKHAESLITTEAFKKSTPINHRQGQSINYRKRRSVSSILMCRGPRKSTTVLKPILYGSISPVSRFSRRGYSQEALIQRKSLPNELIMPGRKSSKPTNSPSTTLSPTTFGRPPGKMLNSTSRSAIPMWKSDRRKWHICISLSLISKQIINCRNTYLVAFVHRRVFDQF